MLFDDEEETKVAMAEAAKTAKNLPKGLRQYVWMVCSYGIATRATVLPSVSSIATVEPVAGRINE